MSICRADFEGNGQLELPFTDRTKRLNSFRVIESRPEIQYVNEEFDVLLDMVRTGQVTDFAICGRLDTGEMFTSIIVLNDSKFKPFEMLGGLELLKQRVMMEKIEW